jgi:transposase
VNLKEEITMPYDIEIGMDLHKMYSVFAAVSAQGEVLSVDKISNDTTLFDRYLGQFNGRPVRVTVENTRGVGWVIQYFDRKKVPLIVSNPFLNRMIANVQCKSDRYDASSLAQLTRTNLIARCYVPSRSTRELRDIIAHRAKLVKVCTILKNKVHQVLAQYNYVQPYSDMFGARGPDWIRKQPFSPLHKEVLEETLQLIAHFQPRILALDNVVKNKAVQHPYYRLLQSVPGVGPLNAGVIIARVEDIGRFPNVDKFVRYAGLAINTRASGDKMHLGKLNKKSDKFMRTALVDAALVAKRKDPGLAQFYDYLMRQKGKAIAKVAVARKLARSVYFVLKKQRPYRYRLLQSRWSNHSR